MAANQPHDLTAFPAARQKLAASHHGDIELTRPSEAPPAEHSAPHNWFPRVHNIDVTSSEPRDVLQSERTLLGFVRFSLALIFMAMGLILGFSIKNDTSPSNQSTHSRTFNKVGSFILLGLAFVTVTVAFVVYFRAVRRYSRHKIQTHSTGSGLMVFSIGAVVVALGGLNVALIVERYKQN